MVIQFFSEPARAAARRLRVDAVRYRAELVVLASPGETLGVSPLLEARLILTEFEEGDFEGQS